MPAKVQTQTKIVQGEIKRPNSAHPSVSKQFVRSNIKELLEKDKQQRQKKTDKGNKHEYKRGVIPAYLCRFREQEKVERVKT